MELNLNSPALLFPAITLVILVYTNRFLALASRIRELHDKYLQDPKSKNTLLQIKNLRTRLHMIRLMQWLGAFSFLLCIVCMYFIYRNWQNWAHFIFGASLLALFISILISLAEIQISTKALEVELSDVEELSKDNVLVDYIKNTFDKDED
jgi:hypothetical protein